MGLRRSSVLLQKQMEFVHVIICDSRDSKEGFSVLRKEYFSCGEGFSWKT